MKVRIRVTKSDIENGYHCNGYLCPIARAVKREFRPNTDVDIFVGGNSVAIKNGDAWEVFDLNKKAAAFIHAFDHEEDARSNQKPFSFTLDIPADLLRK